MAAVTRKAVPGRRRAGSVSTVKMGQKPVAWPITADRIELYREIATAIDRNFSLIDVVDDQIDAHRRGGSGKVAKLMTVWRERLRGDNDVPEIPDVIRGMLPTIEESLIVAGWHAAAVKGSNDAGEAAKNSKAAGWRDAAEIAEMDARTRGSFASTMMMPAMLIFEIMGTLWYTASNLAPVLDSLSSSLGGRPLPALMASLLQFITIAEPTLKGVSIAAGGYAILVLMTLTRYTGRWRPWLDRLFPYATFRTRGVAVAFMQLALLYKARLPLDAALARIVNAAPIPLKATLDILRARVKEGAGLDLALCDVRLGALLPPRLMRKIRFYAKRDALEAHLMDIAKGYLEDAAKQTETMGQWLAMVTIAITLGFGLWIGLAFLSLQNMFSGGAGSI